MESNFQESLGKLKESSQNKISDLESQILEYQETIKDSRYEMSILRSELEKQKGQSQEISRLSSENAYLEQRV